MSEIEPNIDLEKCNVVSCPKNSAVVYEKEGHCELSKPSLQQTNPKWYMTPDRCTHKKFIERNKK